MKKNYEAPEAEVLAFAKEDVITSSGNLLDWELPSIDLGNGDGEWEWSEDISLFKL